DPVARAGARVRALTGTQRGVVIEDKRWTLAIHYRLAERSAIPAIRSAVITASNESDLRVVEGKEVFELRPPEPIDKGVACVELATALGASETTASLFYAGDDRTDEDAFAALRSRFPQALTIRIGDAIPATDAEFTLADPERLETLLGWILV